MRLLCRHPSRPVSEKLDSWYGGWMPFTVTFTGQRVGEGVTVNSMAEAVERVHRLEPWQFPASIWEVPSAEQGFAHGRLVSTYPALPGGKAPRT
jgi:hypothetical protein